MKKNLFRDLIILIGFFGLLWYVFAEFDIIKGDNSSIISYDKEDKLGKNMLKNVLEDPSFKEVEDSIVLTAIFEIKQRLIDAIGLTDYDYNIVVVENSIVNAFTLPGGNIIITSGLIKFSNSAEEIACVIAHEIGHVENRDVIEKLIKELGLSLIMSDDMIIIGEVSKTATSTVFDRKQEREADEYALKLMTKADINPRILAVFFRRIKDEIGAYNEKFEILMTHPHVNSRIKSALEFEIPDGFSTIPFEIDWERVKNRI